jgi:PIN domain nuclease of toxin-antitoxin system
VILLDTNALLQAMTMPHRLGKRTQRLPKNSAEIHYSSISSAELAIKQMIGKLRLEQPVYRLLPGQKFRELPFDGGVVRELFSFTSLQRHDPFDRFILATTRAHGAKLITSDRKMLDLGFDWILDSSQ